MNHKVHKHSVVFATVLFLGILGIHAVHDGLAAMQDADNSVTGTVRLDRKGLPSEQLEVTLFSTTGGGRQEGFTDSSGNFRFDRVRPGAYRVTVRAPLDARYEDGSTDVLVYREPGNTNYSVQITLELKRTVVRAPKRAPGVVSVEELSKNVPKQAKDLYERSRDAAKAGDYRGAATYLEQAIEIAPDFVAALNDLGSYRIRLGKASQAIAPLAHAVEIAPNAFEPRLNLALAHLLEDHLKDASSHIDAVLKADPVSTRALCIGGEISYKLGKLDESLKRLQLAFSIGDDTRAFAAFTLGIVYEAKGLIPQAIEAYDTVRKIEPATERGRRATERLRALGVT